MTTGSNRHACRCVALSAAQRMACVPGFACGGRQA
jgi:hypothetical protein